MGDISGLVTLEHVPVEGAPVTLATSPPREKVTSADGAFRFQSVPVGSYTLEVAAEPDDGELSQTSRVVTVGEGQEAQVEFTGALFRHSRLAGHVLAGGEPVPDARARLSGAVQDEVGTDQSGAFVFDSLPRGQYVVSLAGIDYFWFAFADTTVTLEVATGDSLFVPFEGSVILRPPETPSMEAGEALTPESVALTWSGVARVDEYALDRAGPDTSWTEIARVASDVSRFEDSGLEAATTYSYRVRACNDDGCSEPSDPLEVRTLAPPPPAPSIDGVDVMGAHELRVRWSAGEDPITHFRIRRSVSGEEWNVVGEVDGGEREFVDASLSPATEYSYRVQGCTEGGCSDFSGAVSAMTRDVPPGSPSGLQAAAASAYRVSLYWSAGEGNVSEFVIARRSGSGDWGDLGSVAGTARSFEDDGVQPLTSYTYRVRACNSEGCSEPSAEAEVSTPEAPPASPRQVNAEALSATEIHISWEEGEGSAAGFEVQRSEAGAWSTIGSPSAGETSHVDSGLDPGTTYAYRVRACNAGGCSEYSSAVQATTHDVPPLAPISVTAEAVSAEQVDVAWAAGGGKVEEFRVERRVDGGSWGVVTTRSASMSSYADTSVSPSTAYEYRIRACNSAGCSSPSDAAAVETPEAPPQVPDVPQGLSASAVGTSQVDLAWQGSGELTDEYRLERRVESGSWADLSTVAAAVTQYSDEGLDGGVTYGYRVQACGEGGCSAFSSEVTATTGSSTLELSVAGFHVNQVVQSYEGSVPLIPGREGLLRVFVEANEPNDVAPDVEVRLHHGGSLVHTQVISAPAAGVPTSTDGGASDVAWEYTIPASLVASDLQIIAEVDPEGHVSENTGLDTVYPASGTPKAMDVRSVAPLDIRIVPVHQAVTDLTGDYFSGFMAESRSMLPLDQVYEDVAPVYTTTVDTLQSDNDNGAWLDLLSEINALRVAEGTGQHYYGLVKTNYTSGIAGYGYVGAPTSVGWDRTGSASWIAAHELGHNFGRRHAPCPSGIGGADTSYPYPDGRIGEVGFRNGALLDPDAYRDLMSYCGPRWISDYNFEAVLEFREPSGAAAFVAGGTRQPSLVVWGVIDDGRSVLRPAFEIATRPELPAEPGPYSLDGLDANGVVLFTYSFQGIENGEEDGTRSFALAIPLSSFAAPDLAELQLRRGGLVLDRQERAAGPAPAPALRDVETRLLPGGQTVIEWDAKANPLLVARDPTTGRILSLAQGGSVTLPASASGELELVLSDGVRSQRELRRPE